MCLTCGESAAYDVKRLADILSAFRDIQHCAWTLEWIMPWTFIDKRIGQIPDRGRKGWKLKFFLNILLRSQFSVLSGFFNVIFLFFESFHPDLMMNLHFLSAWKNEEYLRPETPFLRFFINFTVSPPSRKVSGSSTQHINMMDTSFVSCPNFHLKSYVQEFWQNYPRKNNWQKVLTITNNFFVKSKHSAIIQKKI